MTDLKIFINNGYYFKFWCSRFVYVGLGDYLSQNISFNIRGVRLTEDGVRLDPKMFFALLGWRSKHRKSRAKNTFCSKIAQYLHNTVYSLRLVIVRIKDRLRKIIDRSGFVKDNNFLTRSAKNESYIFFIIFHSSILS